MYLFPLIEEQLSLNKMALFSQTIIFLLNEAHVSLIKVQEYISYNGVWCKLLNHENLSINEWSCSVKVNKIYKFHVENLK